ncbi:MAG: L,D-transpeptidase family protein [Pseudomonadota bacterium]|nr:L,D-transpeptidase family protein [Pseudomonadota bacterium]
MMRALIKRGFVLLLLVVSLGACQNFSRISIDSLLGEIRDPPAPPDVAQQQAPATPEPPVRQDTFILADDSDVIGELYVITAREEDTFVDLARKYDLGYNELRDANPGVDPWLPKEGTHVILPARHILPDAPREGVVLNLSALRLFFFPKRKPAEPRIVVTHPIGIGREDWPTPQGATTVVRKVAKPSWHVPASIRAEHAAKGDPLPAVVPPGPDNPLGEFALRLGFESYLIHGTNKPAGIGMRVSHGCIQLFPEDIDTLYKDIPIGTPVRIVNQPYLAGWRDGILYVEAHKPLDPKRGVAALQEQLRTRLDKIASERGVIDWPRIDKLVDLGRGLPLPVERNQPDIGSALTAIPAWAAAQPIQTAPAIVPSRPWYVQAGSFKNQHTARRVSAIIAHLGPPIPARAVANRGYHQVLAGPFDSRAEAEANARRIEASLGTETLVVDPGI